MFITIGAFDGFHKGHAELLKICRKFAVNNDWGVVTFYPYPSQFMKKFDKSLFTPKERNIIRKFLDIPNIFVLSFDSEMRNMTPKQFWEFLKSKIDIDGCAIGSDFKFGHDRAGNAEYLRNLAISDSLKPERIKIIDVMNKSEFSSSNIRAKISKGDIKSANEILGYSWFLIGNVIHGNERGRTMNFPTANIKIPDDKIIPSYGVYSVAVLIQNKIYCGALSIGNNPTFGDVNESRIEVYILDFNGEIYGDELLIMFLDRVRDIRIFPDKAALISQIKSDTEECRKIFNLFNGGSVINYVDRFALSYKF